ncbi:hypothetical protein BLNAU_15804 [Blattamonas nauphoetae]|uniref:UBX domain-containing protein n=1 Tax=Blattamonas nauphoetae TaxID=2049346 RepID=A0ABQ9XDF4_9EUKA|nr:hypothetical protein BLNAU_15804 [Blattamonas nauphoetae]
MGQQNSAQRLTVHYLDTESNVGTDFPLQITNTTTISDIKTQIADRFHVNPYNLLIVEPELDIPLTDESSIPLFSLGLNSNEITVVHSVSSAGAPPPVPTKGSVQVLSSPGFGGVSIGDVSIDASIAYKHSIPQFQLFLNFVKEYTQNPKSTTLTQQTLRKLVAPQQPKFFVGSFAGALSQHFRATRPLAMLIHRVGEIETTFLQSTICDPGIIPLLNSNFILYVVTVPRDERIPKAGLKLIPGFYVLSLIETIAYIHDSIPLSEPVTTEQFATRINTAALVAAQMYQSRMVGNGVFIPSTFGQSDGSSSQVAPRSDFGLGQDTVLEEDRQIKQMTDQEYEESMMIDKAREESMRDEENRILQMIHDQETQERKEKEEEERKERERAERAKQSEIEATELYVDEPDPSTSPSEITTIQLRLPPPHQTVVRKFLRTQQIKNALAVSRRLCDDLKQVQIQAISLPRTIHQEDQTFEEAGLCPRAALIINVISEDDDLE